MSTDDWQPNSPNIKKDFGETQPDKENQQRKDLSKSRTVTQKHVEHLENLRSRPEAEHSPSIDGGIKQEVDSSEDEKREELIKQFKAKLSSSSRKMNKSFNNSR